MVSNCVCFALKKPVVLMSPPLLLCRSRQNMACTFMALKPFCKGLFRARVCVCACVFWSSEHLMKLSMEELVEFLQVTLSKDFFLEDDLVIEHLQTSMTELRRAKLELPAPGTHAYRPHTHTHTHRYTHTHANTQRTRSHVTRAEIQNQRRSEK